MVNKNNELWKFTLVRVVRVAYWHCIFELSARDCAVNINFLLTDKYVRLNLLTELLDNLHHHKFEISLAFNINDLFALPFYRPSNSSWWENSFSTVSLVIYSEIWSNCLNKNIMIFIYQRYTIRWQRQFLQASSDTIHSVILSY